jgi:hypothetical protein
MPEPAATLSSPPAMVLPKCGGLRGQGVGWVVVTARVAAIRDDGWRRRDRRYACGGV